MELTDAIFIVCDLNHTAVDDTSFWHFFHCWSNISLSRTKSTSSSPVLDRRFLASPLPISFPYASHNDLRKRLVFTPVSECFFIFTANTIINLKSKAHSELNVTATRISSIQTLLAHMCISVIKARVLEPDKETTYMMMVVCRSRLCPPLLLAYQVNVVVAVFANSTVGGLVARGLGWAACLLNLAIASQSKEVIRDDVEGWSENLSFLYASGGSRGLIIGSSPSFDMYGNEFGWGRLVVVRSGYGNKVDGKETSYPRREEGGMGLEVCLSPEVTTTLVEDAGFMEAVDLCYILCFLD